MRRRAGIFDCGLTHIIITECCLKFRRFFVSTVHFGGFSRPTPPFSLCTLFRQFRAFFTEIVSNSVTLIRLQPELCRINK
jgi:hypothetical protein